MLDVAQIARTILDAWDDPRRLDAPTLCGRTPPHASVIESIIAVAFEASLLQEEGRLLTFRLILAEPDALPTSPHPAEGLQRLEFQDRRPFTAHELRRLTPAVDYDRSLVGVRVDQSGEIQVWGVVQSGAQWLEQFYGGRANGIDLPDCLIIGVRDPGHINVSRGLRILCALEGGRLQTDRLNVLQSDWLHARFASTRDALMERHAVAKAASKVPWADIDPDFTRMVAQQMVQRLISTIQRSRHGGTLVVVPSESAAEFTDSKTWVNLKYKISENGARSRFSTLIERLMSAMAASCANVRGNTNMVGWTDYIRAGGREFNSLDAAIFEFSHMVATLTAVDGAVVVTRRFELLGFGGEISGTLAEVPYVAKALELEGRRFRVEPTEEVGTRHRSVYRLCNARQDVLGIVASQDGGTRFVRWNESQVMYWNHSTVTPP